LQLFVDDNVYVVAVVDIRVDSRSQNIRVDSRSQNDIFVDMPSLENVHESNDLLKKRTPCLLKFLVYF